MKDPLQAQQTPYEVLNVKPGAGKAEVDKAFAQALRKVPPNKAKAARDTLLRPVERTVLELLHYRDEAVSQLDPNPLEESAVLGIEKRASTAAKWGKQFKKAFPDLRLAHSMAVFWYWWTLHEEERFAAMVDAARKGGRLPDEKPTKLTLLKRIGEIEKRACNPSECDSCATADCVWEADCKRASLPLDEMWRRVIAHWSMLLATPEFWQALKGLSPEQMREARAKLRDTLKGRLTDVSQRYTQLCSDGGKPHEGAAVLAEEYHTLDLTFAAEQKSAEALLDVGVRVRGERVCCGQLMLRYSGLLDLVRGKVESDLKANPSKPGLQFLRMVLAPYAAIGVLIDNKKPQKALELIGRLPEDQRDSREVLGLRAEALRLLGEERASLGEFEAAVDNWIEALHYAPSDAAKDAIRKGIITLCQTQAGLLQQTEPDRAVVLLEKGLNVVDDEGRKLIDDDNLKRTLAAILTARALATFRKAQKLEKDGNLSEEVVRLYVGIVADLERAVGLGSRDAAEQLDAARNLLKRVQNEASMPPEMRRLMREANAAVEADDWDKAVDLLHTALRTPGQGQNAHAGERLAVCLANRAVKKTNRAIEFLGTDMKAHEARWEAFISTLNVLRGLGNLGGSADKCAKCFKTVYAHRYENWYTFDIPKVGKVTLCSSCATEARSLGARPEPRREALDLLTGADADLLEAMELAPNNEYVRKQRKDLDEFLPKIPGVRRAQKPQRGGAIAKAVAAARQAVAPRAASPPRPPAVQTGKDRPPAVQKPVSGRRVLAVLGVVCLLGGLVGAAVVYLQSGKPAGTKPAAPVAKAGPNPKKQPDPKKPEQAKTPAGPTADQRKALDDVKTTFAGVLRDKSVMLADTPAGEPRALPGPFLLWEDSGNDGPDFSKGPHLQHAALPAERRASNPSGSFTLVLVKSDEAVVGRYTSSPNIKTGDPAVRTDFRLRCFAMPEARPLGTLFLKGGEPPYYRAGPDGGRGKPPDAAGTLTKLAAKQ